MLRRRRTRGGKGDLSPEPGQDALLVREADNALIALGRMCMRGITVLQARGWELANDEHGRPVYVRDGVAQSVPPDLNFSEVQASGRVSRHV